MGICWGAQEFEIKTVATFTFVGSSRSHIRYLGCAVQRSSEAGALN